MMLTMMEHPRSRRLTEEEAANGVILSCCSANNSRFKVRACLHLQSQAPNIITPNLTAPPPSPSPT